MGHYLAKSITVSRERNWLNGFVQSDVLGAVLKETYFVPDRRQSRGVIRYQPVLGLRRSKSLILMPQAPSNVPQLYPFKVALSQPLPRGMASESAMMIQKQPLGR